MKVGDYVRTDKGNISKIKWISQQVINSKETKAGTFHLENGEIVHMYYGGTIKSSPNIIDLIEVGDYINGRKVFNPNGYRWLYEDTGDEIEDIKTIVTKEQFSQMEYKLGE